MEFDRNNTHARLQSLSSDTLSSDLFVLSTYSQSQFPPQPSPLLLRVQQTLLAAGSPTSETCQICPGRVSLSLIIQGLMDLSTFYPPFLTHSSFPPSLFPLSSHRSCNLLRFPPSFVSFSPLFCLPPNLPPTTYFPLMPPPDCLVSPSFFPPGFCISAFVKI